MIEAGLNGDWRDDFGHENSRRGRVYFCNRNRRSAERISERQNPPSLGENQSDQKTVGTISAIGIA
jgi:hypothetical protein